MTLRYAERVERLARRLSTHSPGSGLRLRLPGGAAPRPSAVLAVLLPPDRLVFTLRSEALTSHAGQISFPGGKPEPGDADLLAAALRETEEEVSLPSDELEVLGALTPVPTPTGFVIHPFVARWAGGASPPEPRADSDEVAALVLASLAELAAPGVHRREVYRWRGQELPSHEYHLPADRSADGSERPAARIWGATGRITRQLLKLSDQ